MPTRRRPLPGSFEELGAGVRRDYSTDRNTGVRTLTFVETRRFMVDDAHRGIQETVSENHPDWRARRAVRGDVGGPFFTQKRGISSEPTDAYLTGRFVPFSGPYQDTEYIGPLLAITPNGVPIPTSNHSGKSALEAKGTTAISRCKPTNSLADVATFISELYREGLPRMAGSSFWRQKTIDGRKIGDEYLNQEFGWKPVISDVRDISRAIAYARDALKQLERNSRSTVRRRYDFPEETTTQVGQIAFDRGDPATPLWNGLGQITAGGGASTPVYKDTETSRKAWFSGAFVFHLPSGYKSHNALIRLGAQADALLGTDLTPEVLWNLAPWSWAADWFSNAGDVISNLSNWATDGLVLKYGYLMEHSFVKVRYYKTDSRPIQPHNRSFPASVTAFVETKQRVSATPFGFGFNWSSLTARQGSILSAIGITRRR